jgi:hypothetical protein
MADAVRRVAISGAAGIPVLLAAACGGGSGATASRSDETTSTTAAVAVNTAADRVTAEHINLTATDLPGWEESPNPPDASMNAMGARLAACTGAPNESKIDVVDVTSSNFDQGQVEISSDVTMVRTHSDGVADVQAINSPKLTSCVNRIALPAIRNELPSGVTLKTLQTSRFDPPGQAPGSVGLRLAGTMTGTQNGASMTLPFRIDAVNFVVGRAEVSLEVAQFGQPGAVAPERGLVSVLYQRATAASTS